MPQYFCSNDRCGAAIQYSVTKPDKCPKCGKKLGVAAVVMPIIARANPPPPVPKVVEEDEEDYRKPLIAPRRVARAKVVEDDSDPISATHVNPDAENAEDDEEDDVYDKRAARRLAREMLANLNPDHIHVSGDEEDKPIRFGDLVRQDQMTQQ